MTNQFISNYFNADHQRLDLIFCKFKSKLKNQQPATANFNAFKAGLLRHIEWEERLLFPKFELKTGMINQGPTVVMKNEHHLLKMILRAIDENINNPSVWEFIEELEEVINNHNQKEEMILYPEIDNLFNEEEKADIAIELSVN